MNAHSRTTGRDYPSWDDLLDTEANGFSVVVLMRTQGSNSGSTTFVRTIGPFTTHREARSKAPAIRRHFRCAAKDHPYTDILSVQIEPLWKELRP